MSTIQHFPPCEAWYVSGAHADLGIGSSDQCQDRARRRHRPGEERRADGRSDPPHQGRHCRQGHQVLHSRSINRSSPPTPASSCVPRRYWCSAIPRSAPSSSPRTRMPGSTGPCACCSRRTTTATSGLSGPISTGSRAATTSPTAKPSSKWRPGSSTPSSRRSLRGNSAGGCRVTPSRQVSRAAKRGWSDDGRTIRRRNPGRGQCRHRRDRTGAARRSVGRDDRIP